MCALWDMSSQDDDRLAVENFLRGGCYPGADPTPEDAVSDPDWPQPPIKFEDLPPLIELCGGWDEAMCEFAGWMLVAGHLHRPQ